MILRAVGLWRMYRSPAKIDRAIGSRSPVAAGDGRLHAASATTTATKDTALMAKTAADPALATRMPAIGGPIARAASTVTPLSDAAAGICWRGTSSGWIACQAGVVSAAAQPIANSKASSETGSSNPASAIAVKIDAAQAAYTCTAISSRRRSTRSASAPANSAKISVGDKLAV
jgi:hypothetical protein